MTIHNSHFTETLPLTKHTIKIEASKLDKRIICHINTIIYIKTQQKTKTIQNTTLKTNFGQMTKHFLTQLK